MKVSNKILLATGVLACVLLCIAGAGCTDNVNSVAGIVEPVIGTWESTLGTTTFYLNADGTGTCTILGVAKDIEWSKIKDKIYNIDNIEYTISDDGKTLTGSLTTFTKV